MTRAVIPGDKLVMPDVTTQIESLIREFADEIHALIRDVVIDAVSSAPGVAPAKRGPGRPPKTSMGLRAVVRSAPSKSKHVGGRRAPTIVANTIESVRDYIVTKPGMGAEHIGPALHFTTAQLALPIQKLLTSKHITRKGVRRATRYFPGPNASAKVPEPSLGGRPKKKK